MLTSCERSVIPRIALVLFLVIALSGVAEPAAAQSMEPSKIFGIHLVPIPGGDFIMGGGNGEEDERPARRVTLDAFEMSSTEITQDQYEKVTGENPSHFTGRGDLPVEKVTWFDAVSFCNALSVKAGLDPCYDVESGSCDFSKNGFRLPTEAEWEYSCRAGSTTGYYTGSTEQDLAMAGWYGYDVGNSDSRTHPVAEKKPNAWGLYDMHGNVLEWTNDWYGDYDPGATTNPTGNDRGFYKALRGGSWFSEASYCRSAFRINDRPDRSAYFTGFRIVRR
ncbi:MAG: formylglycine-generating enzyme family protein [Candidatus Latescibacteria bacterium]|nr:formylglycine-generating enzyme family protein [Candidatus Latescibacterota bacterium]